MPMIFVEVQVVSPSHVSPLLIGLDYSILSVKKKTKTKERSNSIASQHKPTTKRSATTSLQKSHPYFQPQSAPKPKHVCSH